MSQLPLRSIVLAAITLDPKVWWPLFPLLLLIVVASLSGSVVWAIRTKAPTRDLLIQVLALSAYLFTAVVAMASEGGGRVPAYAHRLPSLLAQGILLAQLVRIWKRADARLLRVLNLIAWGAILTDTGLHYLMPRR
ncbi:MAG TPA: hypothetical protein VGJ57_09905 [Nitrospirales bacterium]